MGKSAGKLTKSVHSATQADFCGLMIAARKKAGLTLQKLAFKLKRPQSFVAKYEGGERRIDVVEFIAICKAIGADPAKILKQMALNDRTELRR